MLLLLNLNKTNTRLLLHKTISKTTYQQKQQMPTSDIQELKIMMKGLMEQMGTMLNLLKTLVSKMA